MSALVGIGPLWMDVRGNSNLFQSSWEGYSPAIAGWACSHPGAVGSSWQGLVGQQEHAEM